MDYWKALKARPDPPLARKRMEELRPIFAGSNRILGNNLYTSLIEDQNLTTDILKGMVFQTWLAHESRPLMIFAQNLLKDNPDSPLFRDFLTVTALVSACIMEERDDLALRVINLWKEKGRAKDGQEFQSLDFLVSDVMSRTGQDASPLAKSTLPSGIDFDKFVLQDIRFIPYEDNPKMVLALVALKRKKSAYLDYSLRVTAVPNKKELLAQQNPTRTFLFWGLKPRTAYRKLPRDRIVVFPFLIELWDGTYEFQCIFEYYVAGKSLYLKPRDLPQNRYSFKVIKK